VTGQIEHSIRLARVSGRRPQPAAYRVVVPSGRDAIVARQRNGRPQAFTDRVRVHERLARRPVTVARATTRPPLRVCVKVAVAE
jgi:hypothetical protein